MEQRGKRNGCSSGFTSQFVERIDAQEGHKSTPLPSWVQPQVEQNSMRDGSLRILNLYQHGEARYLDIQVRDHVHDPARYHKSEDIKQNFGKLLPDYTAQQPLRHSSSFQKSVSVRIITRHSLAGIFLADQAPLSSIRRAWPFFICVERRCLPRHFVWTSWQQGQWFAILFPTTNQRT